MKEIRLGDGKFSLVYDPKSNDRPVEVRRHGQPFVDLRSEFRNWLIVLCYELIELHQKKSRSVSNLGPEQTITVHHPDPSDRCRFCGRRQ